MSDCYNFDPKDCTVKPLGLLKAEQYDNIFALSRESVAPYRLRQRLQSLKMKSRLHSSSTMSKIRYLDISTLGLQEPKKFKDSVLWSQTSMPLEIVELSGVKLGNHGLHLNFCRTIGWREEKTEDRFWVQRTRSR